MTTVFRRMFSIKHHKPLAGIRKRTKLMEEDDMNNFDADDISELEADFMNVGESHKMHEREMQKKKEHLKQQIVIKKYFKEKEPRFITFAEKELIYKLHRDNPDEWTVEKLSESFPALPETIKKILHAKWSPVSMEKVIQYDNIAVKNWKKFHTGELPLDPKLREHLMKFKDRKITLMDRESLAKQFVPQTEFKKPKSKLFSSIVQLYLDEKENIKLLSQEDNPNKVADTSNNSDKIQNVSNTDTRIDTNPKKFASDEEQYSFTSKLHIDSKKYGTIVPFNINKNNDKLLTFDEFVKLNLKKIQNESPEESITLLNIQREQMDANQEIQTVNIATVSDDTEISTHRKEDTASKIVQNSDSILAVSENKDDNSNIVAANDNLLDTSIKVWNKKIDTELNYTKSIKIAKHLYKSGMTYRINDCYYDDDGEFLYRVPGVQS